MLFKKEKFEKEAKMFRSLSSRGLLSEDRKQDLRVKLLATISRTQQITELKAVSVFRLKLVLKYLILFLAGLGIMGGTALASWDTLPGDFLYPVKRTVENAQFVLILKVEHKADLESKLAEKRLAEFRKLKQVNMEFGQKEEKKLESVKFEDDSLLAKSEFQKRQNKQFQARVEAQTQVGKAIRTLIRIKAKEEAGGNINAANRINENIQKLLERFSNAGIILEIDPEKEGLDNSGRLKVRFPFETLEKTRKREEINPSTFPQGIGSQREKNY